MTHDDDTSTERSTRHPNTGRVRAGILLVLVGTLGSAIGSLIASAEFAVATRRWLKEQQTSAVAIYRLRQALVASQAGTHAAVDAWRSPLEQPVSSPS
jgi:hypothetical protein